jgi:hypothetical protein
MCRRCSAFLLSNCITGTEYKASSPGYPGRGAPAQLALARSPPADTAAEKPERAPAALLVRLGFRAVPRSGPRSGIADSEAALRHGVAWPAGAANGRHCAASRAALRALYLSAEAPWARPRVAGPASRDSATTPPYPAGRIAALRRGLARTTGIMMALADSGHDFE